MKYFINYEALVYNMPEIDDYEFWDHKFIVNYLTKTEDELIIPDNDPLKANYSFIKCCIRQSDGCLAYITAKNKTPLIVNTDSLSEDSLSEVLIDQVENRVEALEQHLLLITGLHFFFPAIKINGHSEDGTNNLSCAFKKDRPMPLGRWSWINEGINLERRLQFGLNNSLFDEFRLHKNHQRYNRAYNYYINSFYELNHSVAFCLLISAIDAITGSCDNEQTKERLAKYSSALFCTPLEIKKNKAEMRRLYKLRSEYVHGKENKITPQDELQLRGYVRKFLLAYYLFWKDMNIKNEPEMLQKLDEILVDPSLYVIMAPAAYSFIRSMTENEQNPNSIIEMSMRGKVSFITKILTESLSQAPSQRPSDEQANNE